MQKYYDALGVNRSSSQEEIKKAFHKLAHLHHPDKPGGNSGKFKIISEAYSYLMKHHSPVEDDDYGPSYYTSTATGWGEPPSKEDFQDMVRRMQEQFEKQRSDLERIREDEILRQAEEIKRRRNSEAFRRAGWYGSSGTA